MRILNWFRQGDVGYITELLEASRKAGKHPVRYRKAGRMTDKFNQKVCDIVINLFEETELPYRIEHWKVRGQYRGLGLFARKSTEHSAIVKATQAEQSNAELLWSLTTGKRHDCVFESEWLGDSSAPRALGWWWKQHFVNEDTEVIVGIVDHFVPSHCPAWDSPPSHVGSGHDGNDIRFSSWKRIRCYPPLVVKCDPYHHLGGRAICEDQDVVAIHVPVFYTWISLG